MRPFPNTVRLLAAAGLAVCGQGLATAYEVTVDNVDPHHVGVTGAWRSTRDAAAPLDQSAENEARVDAVRARQYGFEYLDDRNTGKGTKEVAFRPSLDWAGRYQVSVWYPAGEDRARAVPVDVHHDGGIATVRVDQTRDGGWWHSLGTYRFSGSTIPRVVIRTAGTEGRVAADAVRFELEEGTGLKMPIPDRPEEVLSLGEQPMLLIDDFALAAKEGVRRIYPQAVKSADGAPILRPDQPWEEAASFGSLATVIYDQSEKIFKMWYWPRRFMYAFATSRDGIAWAKNPLGLVEWGGNKTNNLIPANFGKHLLVYQDTQETDPAHRYKGATDSRTVSQARLMHSADGIHWLFYNHAEPVTYRAADFTNHVLWDPAKQAHLLFTRTDYGTTGGAEEFRGVRVMINADLKRDPDGWRTLNNWILDRPGDLPARRQVYFLIDQIHAGVHIALVAVYEHIGDLGEGSEADTSTRHERDVLNAYVISSRDGVEWNTDSIYDGQPVIPRGGKGAFDKDVIMPSSFVTVGDEHFVYYNGWNERHNLASRPGVARAVGLARIPRDRFSGLRADGYGTLATKPFRAGSRELAVNADARAGRILVEVLDETGRVIPGYSLTDAVAQEAADATELPVTWKARRFAELQGKTVRLRFHLTNSGIFSFGYRTAGP